MANNVFYPLLLEPSFHETIWGGRRLERDGWKQLPPGDSAIGESWETEMSTLIENGLYTGMTLGALVEHLGTDLLGTQVLTVFGQRFPLLAKFIDANAQLSVQVHPNDTYADTYEQGKLGKTEFWYILAAEPGAKIVYGFKQAITREEVRRAIQNVTLETLLHEETVQAGDVIFVPAGTVHAIGSGIVVYELQEYSDITYRMYDYGRVTASGKARELHIERSLDVSNYIVAEQVKVTPVALTGTPAYTDRCLVACRYFVARELCLKPSHNVSRHESIVEAETGKSCTILTSLGAEARVYYGDTLTHSIPLSCGRTMILPAALGRYRVEGTGTLLLSYVPTADDPALRQWEAKNKRAIFSSAL